MIESEWPEADDVEVGTETYVPPAFEVLGTVQQITQGPVAGDGDVPTGLISF